MKKAFFKFLHTINQAILPKYSQLDPAKLTKFQQAIVAYKYYVLVNSMD